KAQVACNALTEHYDVNIDWTPTLANAVIKGCTGRGVSMLLLNQRFGTPGRKADDKSPDFERVDQIIAQVRPELLRTRREAETCMNDLIRKQKKKYKKKAQKEEQEKPKTKPPAKQQEGNSKGEKAPKSLAGTGVRRAKKGH
ncbi:hypothetical protein, partial [Endozoicomonas sp. ONNA1]|uniref:hypothetical protein n=1 Tax=Endozoicomonas sp. ONNA1 TaxID=2828740 RepID=UPI0021493868